MNTKFKRKAKRIWKKSVKRLDFSVFKKFAVVVLILGMNWSGIAAISHTAGYFSDSENSTGNAFNTATLEFSLNPATDFIPPILNKGGTASYSTTLVNNGNLGFQYMASASYFSGASDLCSALQLNATLNGATVYDGGLTGFSVAAGNYTVPSAWNFTVTLPSGVADSLLDKTCNFKLIFTGWQQDLPSPASGFSDVKEINAVVSSGTPVTDKYSPITDAYVAQKYASANYGSDENLSVASKNGENARTYIKFDFRYPSGTVINSSLLTLFMSGAPGSSRTIQAKKVTSPWTESGITWNNQPSLDGVTNTANTGTSVGRLSWDVASDVRNFVASPLSNYGWELNDSLEDAGGGGYGASFYSRDNVHHYSQRPYLQVGFTAPAATTSHLVINEVYANVVSWRGSSPDNQWVEIYNPTGTPVSLNGWKLCNNSSCDTIPSGFTIPAKGFAIVTDNSSTWGYYRTDLPPSIPAGAVKIVLGSPIGGGLSNSGDRVILKDASGDTDYQNTTGVVDAMSYGGDATYLILPTPKTDISLARIVKGYDTDSAYDWVLNSTPNPGTNPSGDDGMEVMRFTDDGIEVAASVDGLPPEEQTQPQPEDSGQGSDSLASASLGVIGAIQDLLGMGQDGAISPAPVASGSIEPSLSPSPEVSPEVSPEPSATPEPTVTPEPPLDSSSGDLMGQATDNPQPAAGDGSSIQSPTDPAILVEPTTIETPTVPAPTPDNPPLPTSPSENLGGQAAPTPVDSAPAE